MFTRGESGNWSLSSRMQSCRRASAFLPSFSRSLHVGVTEARECNEPLTSATSNRPMSSAASANCSRKGHAIGKRARQHTRSRQSVMQWKKISWQSYSRRKHSSACHECSSRTPRTLVSQLCKRLLLEDVEALLEGILRGARVPCAVVAQGLEGGGGGHSNVMSRKYG